MSTPTARTALNRVQLQSIINAITKHYPKEYADNSWDNTGLLLDCSVPLINNNNFATATTTNITLPLPKALLTVDLTQSVAQEAIDKGCSIIIAYHPFIFSGIKAILPSSMANPQHRSLIKLIQHNISVYCPHTAVDAAVGGVNDWLAEGLVRFQREKLAKVVCIEPVSSVDSDKVGYGRLVTLEEGGITLSELLKNIKAALKLEHVQVSSNYGEIPPDRKIRRIALCAGSGSGVFKALTAEQEESIDLFYTGELSHHETLRLKEMGKIVVTCNHSNTERGYVRTVMADMLRRECVMNVIVSETDRDPLMVV